MSAETSGFKVYSLGIVVAAKIRGDDYIYVDPIEHLSQDKGMLSEINRNKKIRAQDAKGIIKQSQMEGGITIIAKWIGGDDSNRQTPPDVQPGETVRIYSFADTNDYYWSTHFREPNLRRLETVRHSYCNLPKGIAKFGDTTSYWLEWSTHDKHVKLHTSSNDGEPTAYDVIIDTGAGAISITDELGNSLVFDSAAGTLKAVFTNEITLEAPLVRLVANQVVNETPLVVNTGSEQTAGSSTANPHINCVD